LEREAARARRGVTDRDIAIVGMVGRFPGAGDVATFWSNLVAGVDSVTHFEEGALDPTLDPEMTSSPSYVRARGILPDAELFDAAFFGITPREAELMDPQQRLLLEVAWETLEDAGHADDTDRLTIGVFAGKYNDSYYQSNVLAHPDKIAALGAFQAMVANEKDYVATRIAHRLDLRGPALSIHTACSTSLVAIAEAVKALRDGDADLALAGGVSVTVPVQSGYVYQEGGMLSPDGRTRPFDASAAGTVFSDGVGMLALRRLSDALADGDTIHAVIRGVAVNNDGARKASFTAPSVEGQALVVARAQADAGVAPAEISYVEAHGTATPLGDPIEVEALSRAFRRGAARTSPCALGSVKSNVGHLVIAAGAAGLIKTALALRHRTLPATLHFQESNPRLLLDEVPFRVVARTEAWDPPSGVRIAGVSSFGVGGTNAHVIVQEPPSVPPSARARSHELLLLSARTERDLAASSERLAGALRGRRDEELADVAFSLHAGRRLLPIRRAFVAATTEEAVAALTSAGATPQPRSARGARPRVAFLFPGQGAQHALMGATLYRDEPAVRELIDLAAARLRGVLGADLRERLFPAGGDAEAAEAALRETRVAQPALFAAEYALARYWQRLGVVPSVMSGHSVGEFVAAALAGVFSFEDGIDLVAARGAIMQSMPPGAMLSVRLSRAELERRLPEGVEIASDNSPTLCVAAGDLESIARLEADLGAADVPSRRLVTSHAFHSAQMDAAVAPFEARVRAVRLSAPRSPIVSTATGRLLSAAEATDPAYWAAHLRRRVRFSDGVAPLAADAELVLLEVGPRATLTTLARQHAPRRGRAPIVPSLGDTDAATWPALLRAAGELWSAGVPLDPAALHGPRRMRVAL
ncbi:MAG: type I polyketide synthase, partial [Deltaproteobacteria bacterium]|nr:type I polyketide synthase [Deltaproteobacteria bacterium]